MRKRNKDKINTFFKNIDLDLRLLVLTFSFSCYYKYEKYM